jgi:hypothetical protein
VLANGGGYSLDGGIVIDSGRAGNQPHVDRIRVLVRLADGLPHPVDQVAESALVKGLGGG